MKKYAFLILFFVSSLSYAAAEEETMDVPEEMIDVPEEMTDVLEEPIDVSIKVSEKGCPICLSQMTHEEFQKNETMNGNKIHDNCIAKEDYFLHKDCFFQGLKNHILMGYAKIPFKFSAKLKAHSSVLFYDPTYVIDFLYSYFAGSDEEGQNQLDSLVAQFLKNWESFARIVVGKEIRCQNSECDGFYANPEKDIYYKPVGEICSKCGNIYSKKAFTKLDKKTLSRSRLCPACGDIVERISGCSAMTCPHCKTEFNWEKAGRISKISWGSKKR